MPSAARRGEASAASKYARPWPISQQRKHSKLSSEHPLFLVVWARYAGQALVATPIAWHRGGHGFWRTRHPVLQVLRSLCLVTATACFFGGLRYLPLAEGSAISFLAPVFAVLLSI